MRGNITQHPELPADLTWHPELDDNLADMTLRIMR